MQFSFEEFYVKRSNMESYFGESGIVTGTPLLSLYLPPGASPDEIKEMAVSNLPEEITKAVISSMTGAVLFLSEYNSLVIPPFPITEKVVFTGSNAEPLFALLNRDYEIGLVLVHLGNFAVGICRGDKLVSSKVGTGHIQGRTKKGGSSSARYQRRRQNQAKEFLGRVCLHVREQFESYLKTLDYIQYGGPRLTIEKLHRECPYLKAFSVKTLPLMDVPPLRQNVLEASVTRLWSSRIIRWRQD